VQALEVLEARALHVEAVLAPSPSHADWIDE
jgi:hypothetical protein